MRVRSSSPALTSQCGSMTVGSTARSRGSAAPRSLVPPTCPKPRGSGVGNRLTTGRFDCNPPRSPCSRVSSRSRRGKRRHFVGDELADRTLRPGQPFAPRQDVVHTAMAVKSSSAVISSSSVRPRQRHRKTRELRCGDDTAAGPFRPMARTDPVGRRGRDEVLVGPHQCDLLPCSRARGNAPRPVGFTRSRAPSAQGSG